MTLYPFSHAFTPRRADHIDLPLPVYPIRRMLWPGAIPVGYAESIVTNPVGIPGVPPLSSDLILIFAKYSAAASASVNDKSLTLEENCPSLESDASIFSSLLGADIPAILASADLSITCSMRLLIYSPRRSSRRYAVAAVVSGNSTLPKFVSIRLMSGTVLY